MQEHIIVWDLETVPDLEAFAAVSGVDGTPETEIRGELGDKFPKLIFHRIACIGALIISRTPNGWQVDAIGAPHIGERSERDLIQAFVDRIGELRPRLVTFIRWAVCGILLAGCATTQDIQSMAITEDTALVSFVGHNGDDREKLTRALISEAAKVTRERGYSYFVVPRHRGCEPSCREIRSWPDILCPDRAPEGLR